VLSKVSALLQRDCDVLKDNVVGCLCRMITHHPQNMPVNDTLCLISQFVPLRQDMAEYEPLFGCIDMLISAQHPVDVGSFLPSFGVSDATIKHGPVMRKILNFWATRPEFSAGVSQLDAQSREVIVKLME
jgi:hypothetical protein